MIHSLTSSDYANTFKESIKWVAGIHILIALISIFGFPDFRLKKIPSLTIELSVLAPSSGGDQESISRVAIPQKVEKKDQVLPKDKNGNQTKEVPQTSSASSVNSSLGPAAAPTSDADYKASYLKNPKPPYPPLAVKMRLEGRVSMLVEVLPNGRAGKVAIESSSGHELLDQSALQTIKEWQFTPAKKDGVIVSQVVRIPINFNLKSR